MTFSLVSFFSIRGVPGFTVVLTELYRRVNGAPPWLLAREFRWLGGGSYRDWTLVLSRYGGYAVGGELRRRLYYRRVTRVSGGVICLY